jgi:ribosomal protein L13E
MSWFDRTRKRAPISEPKPALPAPMESAGREMRPAAGFSLLELERAGLSEEQAERRGLIIDRNRRSALGMNVAQLKRLLET